MDQYSELAVWSDPAMMEPFVNRIYATIGNSLDRPMMSVLTDETTLNTDHGGTSNVTKSLVTPDDYSFFNIWGGRQAANTWGPIYSAIRACNLFLEKAEENEYADTDWVNRLKGEVYFLRAYHNHILAFMYGGFPIIEKPYTLSDDFKISRNTFEECIDFVIADCDRAASLLPIEHPAAGYGRATQGAALALKARVRLYAASELYNNQTWTGGYAHPELVGYVGADRNALWKLAKDAAKAVMDLNVYEMHKKVPAPGESVYNNYEEIFLSTKTSESIFLRLTDPALPTTGIGRINGPNGYHNWGNHGPTRQIVDAYEMSNGDKFDWDNPAHRANPYQNRDPRFYANILYDGAKWRPRPSDVESFDPVGIIETSMKQQADGTWRGGLDTRNSAIDAYNGSTTNYYMRKFMDSTINSPLELGRQPWNYIRYTEVLLSYAEACAELGEEGEARDYINMIRARVALPEISTSGDALIESIRQERKVELMFEDQRFWDIRRWMIASQVMEDAHAIKIEYFYGNPQPVYSSVFVQEREWRDRFYFLPIQTEELNKNELLLQNPLY